MGPTTRTMGLSALLGVIVVVFLAIALVPRSGPGGTPPGGSTGAAPPSPATRPPDARSPGATPAAPPHATGSAVAILVGAGDIAECSEGGDDETAALVEAVEGTVFTLGDNVYEDGTIAEFEACYGPTWGRPSIKGRTRPVAGNHEYRTPDAAGYFRYFGSAAGDPDEGWYAFDAGAWRIYALNTNCAEIGGCQAGSPQERWLREDLATNPRPCVAALAHHPRFSSGDHGDNEFVSDLWRTLQEAGAELILGGHDHSYERFAPQDATGRADERGLVQLVVGTGGRDPYPFREPKPNSQVRASPVFGVIRLELRPGSYAFAFRAVPGDDFSDSGSGACH